MKESKLKTISFSSLGDYRKCGFYFYLKKIEKIAVDTDTIWTYYGKWVHQYLQAVLLDELDPETAAKKFIRTWFKFCGIYKKQVKEQYKGKNPKDLYINPTKAMLEIKDFLKKQFGEYKVLYIEERLEEGTGYPQTFVGYIDVVLELSGGKIVILDIKTCSSHYFFKKYKDKYKDYQLSLYKSFLCKKYNIKDEDIVTWFLTLAKDPKVKPPLGLLEISSGKKKVNNALSWLNGVLKAVERDNFIKNRMSCDNFYGKSCPFKGTEYCP